MTRASAVALALTVRARRDCLRRQHPEGAARGEGSAAKRTAAPARSSPLTSQGPIERVRRVSAAAGAGEARQAMAVLNPHAWSMQDLKAKELSLNAVIADACE